MKRLISISLVSFLLLNKLLAQVPSEHKKKIFTVINILSNNRIVISGGIENGIKENNYFLIFASGTISFEKSSPNYIGEVFVTELFYNQSICDAIVKARGKEFEEYQIAIFESDKKYKEKESPLHFKLFHPSTRFLSDSDLFLD